jgi:prolyl-tRNA synthetase
MSKSLTDEQQTMIQRRKNGLKAIMNLVGAMDRLLDEVRHEYMDETGKKVNPWLIADEELIKANEQWEGYKKELLDQVEKFL